MKSSKEEIQDYAKHLYFEGLSFRKIADSIKSRFEEEIGYTTIKNWSENKGWRASKELAQVRGILKGKKESKDDDGQQKLIGTDEKILDKITRDSARQYKESQEVRKIGLNLIKTVAISKDEEGKQIIRTQFDSRQLSAAVQAFKAGSEDMRKIEIFLNNQNFDPSKMSDDELEEMANS